MTVLHDGWTLRATAGPVPQDLVGVTVPPAVPGCVHTDLLAAGLIADPYLDAHEGDLVWMHRTDWRFSRPLRLEPAAPDERVDLAFDGLDTVATLRLGDCELGRTVNMHRSYRFDVRALADGVERDLVVDLASATVYAEDERERLGERPSTYPTPFNYVRKMACSFGWDWGPDLRTAGLWKPVRLERWRTARLARVRPLVTVEPDGTGRVEVRVDLERSGLGEPHALVVRVEVAGQVQRARVAPDLDGVVVVARVPRAPLWWPVGYGEQPLVPLTVTVHDADEAGPDAALDTWTRRIGFRTVELDTSDDEHGTAFALRVNGRPVFVKGVNWIPDDHLLTRITRDRLAQRFDQALGAHANLLRVWGGGIYESEDFYELADERGLLVWQDVLLACAAYAEEEPLAGELEAEVRENVARLTPHPSLVLWNGGNENLCEHDERGRPALLQGRTWGEGYVRDLLPRLVAEVDPTRPYADNSPYSPRRTPAQVHPNDPDHGTHHQWDVWNRLDYTAYRDEVPRFCSELGFQGPPTWRTLVDSMHAADGRPLDEVPAPKDDPVWLVHQKADDGNGKLDRGMAPHVGVPAGFTDWLWAAQLVQARAVRYAVEHYRSWWPRTTGSIVWQLNDCWPVTSWSAIDGAGRPKPLWHALRAAYAPRLLTFVVRDDALVVALVNDTDEPWTGELMVRRERLDGAPRARELAPVTVAARSVHLHRVAPPVVVAGDPRREVLVATLDGCTAVHTDVEDVDLLLDPAALASQVEAVADGYRVRVRALGLVSDLMLHVDRVDPQATVDVGMLTLPAGAEATLRVRCAPLPDPAVLTRAPVLRTANDLRAVAQAPGCAPLPPPTPRP
ncbi:MAG: glycoside hydrolase family 2 protein [Cellulomonas sp.]|nr:glycoside hydrolase family 2 protein [Cellulomonas sp.]